MITIPLDACPTPPGIAPRVLRALVTLVVVTASTGAAAMSCDTPSPALERLGADYLLLDDDARTTTDGVGSRHAPSDRPLAASGELSPPDARRLAHLLRVLETGSLDGIDGERTRCRGADDTLREVRWQFDLERLERVGTIDGRTVLTAFEARHTVSGDDRLVADTLVAETVDVPPADAWRPSEDGTRLRANRRFRRAGAAPNCPLALDRRPLSGPAPDGAGLAITVRCSHLAEMDTSARFANGTLEIEQVLYVGGRWSERVLWRLAP